MTDFVDDEQQVTHIQRDVAADARIEGDIAHGTFPDAVEIDADQVAVGIQHGTAGIAAGGVVRREEAHRLVVPAAFCIDIPQGLGDIVIEDVGIVLLDDAFQGRNRPVIYRIHRLVARHLAVGHTQGEVGVRIEGLFLLKGHLALHIASVGRPERLVRLADDRLDLVMKPGQESLAHLDGGIFEQALDVRFREGLDLPAVREDRLGEKAVPPGFHRAVVPQLLQQPQGLERSRKMLAEGGYHRRKHLTVNGFVIVLIEGLDQRSRRRPGPEPGQDARRELDDFDGPDSLVIIFVGQVAGVPSGIDGAELVHDTLVAGPFGPVPEARLIGLFGGHRFHPGQPPRLALPFLPGVGERRVLRGILDPDSRIPGHVFLLDIQPLGA